MRQPIKKLSLYLETSVWNFMYAYDAPDKMKATKQFFKEVQEGRYHLFISDLVASEVGRAKRRKKVELENLIRQFGPTQLAWNDEVNKLTDAYLEANIVPKKAEADMIHMAHAVIHNLDVIVSWNLRHIVRLKTKLAVNGVNKLLGYREIEIVTPEEVVGYGS